jgi:hypothetical protein
MSAASWGRPRPTSTPWRERGGALSASPCECENGKFKLPPFEDRASGGAVAYLRVETPRFLFLWGTTGVVSAADVATAAPPDTSAARAASLMDCLVTGAPAPAPGAGSSSASAALGEEGSGSHLLGRARPSSLSSSSSSSNDEYSEVAEGESTCCSRSRNSSSFCSRRSCRWILFSFLRAARSCSRRCAGRAHARTRGVGGSAGDEQKIRPRRCAAGK